MSAKPDFESVPELWAQMRGDPVRAGEREEAFALVGCLVMSGEVLDRLRQLLAASPWLCGVEDSSRSSPLMLAASMGHEKCLELMVAFAHPLDWLSVGGPLRSSALALAANADRSGKCARILAPRSNLLHLDAWGRSAAMIAAYYGDAAFLAEAINGSDPLATDKDGLDLLGCAARSGVLACCDLALARLDREGGEALLERSTRASSMARAQGLLLVAERIKALSLALWEARELGGSMAQEPARREACTRSGRI